MDKQMIEEMYKDLQQANFYATDECLGTECEDCKHKSKLNNSCKKMLKAEYLYNAGYRKIEEGAVVMTREKYEKLCDLAYFGNGEETTRKETAEKFAERLRKVFEKDDDWDEYSVGTVRDYIDEICEELSEGN